MLALSVPAAAPGFSLVQHAVSSSATTGNNSWSVTLPSTVAGNLLTVVATWYYAGSNITSVTASNGTVMSQATGAFINSNNNVAIFWGKNVASGPVTITVNYTSGTGNYPGVYVQEWSGVAASGIDEGIGTNTSVTAASISITTTGSTTQANSLILSAQTPSSTNPTGVGANQTLLDSTCSYQLTDSSGAAVTHIFNYSGSQAISAAIAAFAHA
jgi:hypothetical protein